jgi:hypothetical protein
MVFLKNRIKITPILEMLSFLLLIFFSIQAQLFGQSDKVEYYKNKFKVECADEKITDNFGNGFDSLYGTRNMRTILFGIAYRGGANNYYNKNIKRDNHNPLPDEGLKNLAMLGFSTAVYLYGTNFKTAPSFVVNPLTNDTLRYYQIGGNNTRELRKIMLMVKEVIEDNTKGPIYFHCWNGWHQSGYISAALLMQFCGLSNEQAYQYWLDNTDGVNKGYDNVKNLVKSFKPFDDIKINEKTKSEICPCIKSKK